MTARKKSPPASREADKSRALRLIAALEKTPSGAEATAFIKTNSVRIFFVDRIRGKGIGTFAKKRDFLPRATAEANENGGFSVYLRKNLPDAVLSSLLMHELRHVWQFSRQLNKPERQTPFERMIRIRFMEADAYSFQIANAWEMALAGDKNPWLFVKMEFPVMTAAFEKAMAETGEILYARRTAFESFFEHIKLAEYYAEIALQMGINDLETTAETIARQKLVPETIPPRHAAPLVIAHQHKPETRLSRRLLLIFGESMNGNGKNYLRDVPGLDVTDKRLIRQFSDVTLKNLEEIEKTYDMKPADHRRVINSRKV